MAESLPNRPVDIIIFKTTMPERKEYLDWLKIEQEQYADLKFGDQRPQHDQEMLKDKISEDSWWYNQFAQYIQRARVLGLENPNGRQALVKCSAALIGCIESMIRVYGDLPEAGHSSGNIVIKPKDTK